MKHLNKAQTLLNDLLDTLLKRSWHVKCHHCLWEVRYLKHARFAKRRGQLHHNNVHTYKQMVAALKNEPIQLYEVWHSRA